MLSCHKINNSAKYQHYKVILFFLWRLTLYSMSYWRQCCFQILCFFFLSPTLFIASWLKLMELYVNTSITGLFVFHLPICLLFQWATAEDMQGVLPGVDSLEEAVACCFSSFTKTWRGKMCCASLHHTNCRTDWWLFPSLPSWPTALWAAAAAAARRWHGSFWFIVQPESTGACRTSGQPQPT